MPKYIIEIITLLFSIIVASFVYGYTRAEKAIEYQYQEQVIRRLEQLEIQQQKSFEISSNIRNNIIKFNDIKLSHNTTLHKKAHVYEISHNNSKCNIIESDLVRLYNEAITMPSNAQPSIRTVAETSGTTKALMLENIIVNYQSCHDAMYKLVQWQDWYNQQQSIFNVKP